MGNGVPLEVRTLNSDLYRGISLPAGADSIARYVWAMGLSSEAVSLNGVAASGMNDHPMNEHGEKVQIAKEKEYISKVVDRQSVISSLQKRFDEELEGRYRFFGKTGIILSYDRKIVCEFDVNFRTPKVHYEKISQEDRNKFNSVLRTYFDIAPYDGSSPKPFVRVGLAEKAHNLQHQAVVLSHEFAKEVPKDYDWFIEHIFLAPFFWISDTLFVAITGTPKIPKGVNGTLDSNPRANEATKNQLQTANAYK